MKYVLQVAIVALVFFGFASSSEANGLVGSRRVFASTVVASPVVVATPVVVASPPVVVQKTVVVKQKVVVKNRRLGRR